MTVSNIQDYMSNLLVALKHIHSFSIIHRDIKPGNFLHSRRSGRYVLELFVRGKIRRNIIKTHLLALSHGVIFPAICNGILLLWDVKFADTCFYYRLLLYSLTYETFVTNLYPLGVELHCKMQGKFPRVTRLLSQKHTHINGQFVCCQCKSWLK